MALHRQLPDHRSRSSRIFLVLRVELLHHELLADFHRARLGVLYNFPQAPLEIGRAHV